MSPVLCLSIHLQLTGNSMNKTQKDLCVPALILGAIMLIGFGNPQAADRPSTKPGQSPLVKLSQYDRAEFCDLAGGSDGQLHAVFTDQPAYDKPRYLYYRASSD